MQLHALDHLGQVINARRAQRQQNYRCLECKQDVRLRGGPHRQPHFYHFEPTIFCRQHGKGAIHLKIQHFFVNQLSPGDCILEYPFPTIGRIADVAWLSQKIVFEIQYSAISGEEALARNRDYQKEGWTVVWILHDHRYNQIRLSAVEMALEHSPHFFTNMDQFGKGLIYDQFDLKDKGLRLSRLSSLPIDIKNISHQTDQKSFPLLHLENRAKNWPYYFAGDFMSLFLSRVNSEYLEKAFLLEKRRDSNQRKAKFFRVIKGTYRKITAGYQIFFRFFLERLCR